jgi:hypothetical protein
VRSLGRHRVSTNQKAIEDVGIVRVGRIIDFALLASDLVVVRVVAANALAAGPDYLPLKEVGRLVFFVAIWLSALRGLSIARTILGLLATLGLAP